MKLILTIGFFCCLLFTAFTATITIPVSKDAQVTYSSYACAPDTCPNMGGDPLIVIGNYQITSIGLFGFDLSSIPTGSTITSASLLLPTGTSPFGATPIGVNVYKLDDNSWGEYTVVWSNKPTYSTLLGSTTFVQPNQPPAVSVTSAVQQFFATPGKSVGFAVTVQSPYNIFFDSRESQTGTAASLSVTYTSGGSVTCGGKTCPPSDQCCSGVCYNVNTHTCTSQGKLCPIGNESCGVACYNPNQYVCFGTFLCPVNHLKCGGACYRPSQYTCCGEHLAPVGTVC